MQATTWLQVSGHRYLVRRIERALLGADLRGVQGPWRASLAIGCAVAAVGALGCAVLWPRALLGDARIAMGQSSGALYVRVGDTWHPVLNLASARLIARTDADPRPVRETDLARTKRGPSLGIPGAPQSLAPALSPDQTIWTICDSGSTTILVGPTAALAVRRVAADRALLVAVASSGPAGGRAYLLYHGQRAMVDLADRAVVRALRLQGRTPRIVSQALLNAIPEGPPITALPIRGAGAPAGAWLPGYRVGGVLRITRVSGDEYYVVLSSGVQRIGQVTADLLLFGGSRGGADVIAVPPEVLRTAPIVDALPVAGIPEQAPSDAAGSTVCATWAPNPAGGADIGLLTGEGPPSSAAVTLVQADGHGPAVDGFQVAPGHTAYVASQGVTGDRGLGGTRYLVTDTGVRFAIHDDAAARDLGLPLVAAPAPWPVLGALPGGPELSREQASVARDAVGTGP